jgi:hypothetical protein
VTTESSPPALPLEWSVWPAKEKPLLTLGLILLLLAIWIGVGYIYREAVWVVLAVVLLSGAVEPYFVVTRFRLDEEGIAVRHLFTTKQKPWAELRSWYPDRNGVLVSPFAQPSRLENFRGLYLRFGDRRTQVLAVLEYKIRQGGKQS